MEQVLIKKNVSALMKVHRDFKKWCEEIQKKNPDLTLIKITKLIVQHNSSDIIKGDLIEYER